MTWTRLLSVSSSARQAKERSSVIKSMCFATPQRNCGRARVLLIDDVIDDLLLYELTRVRMIIFLE
jgi:hypothetical protein